MSAPPSVSGFYWFKKRTHGSYEFDWEIVHVECSASGWRVGYIGDEQADICYTPAELHEQGDFGPQVQDYEGE